MGKLPYLEGARRAVSACISANISPELAQRRHALRRRSSGTRPHRATARPTAHAIGAGGGLPVWCGGLVADAAAELPQHARLDRLDVRLRTRPPHALPRQVANDERWLGAPVRVDAIGGRWRALEDVRAVRRGVGAHGESYLSLDRAIDVRRLQELPPDRGEKS